MSNACDRALEALHDTTPGSAGPDEVAEHVRDCRTCARELRRLEALDAALDALPTPRMPSGFTQSVMQALPEMLPAREGAGHVVRWGAVAAAIVLAFAAGLALTLDGAGSSVAHEVLDPIAATLRLSGAILGHGATLAATCVDAMGVALVATRGFQLALCAVLVAASAALATLAARFRLFERS